MEVNGVRPEALLSAMGNARAAYAPPKAQEVEKPKEAQETPKAERPADTVELSAAANSRAAGLSAASAVSALEKTVNAIKEDPKAAEKAQGPVQAEQVLSMLTS